MSSPRPGANLSDRDQRSRADRAGTVLAVPQTGGRIAAGTWNLVLGSLLLSHGYRWGVVLFAVSALIFWAAYILARGKFESLRNDQR